MDTKYRWIVGVSSSTAAAAADVTSIPTHGHSTETRAGCFPLFRSQAIFLVLSLSID